MDQMEFSAESSSKKGYYKDQSVQENELQSFRKALATLEFVMRLNNYAQEGLAGAVPTVLSLDQLMQKLAEVR